MTPGFIQAFTRLGGDVLSEDPTISNRNSVEILRATGSITAGDWVMYDISGVSAGAGPGALMCANVVVADETAIGMHLVCGVALESATAGKLVSVITRGFCLRAKAQDSVSTATVCATGPAGTGSANALAGQAQVIFINTSGASTTQIPICGIALTDEGRLADGTTAVGYASFYVTCGR